MGGRTGPRRCRDRNASGAVIRFRRPQRLRSGLRYIFPELAASRAAQQWTLRGAIHERPSRGSDFRPAGAKRGRAVTEEARSRKTGREMNFLNLSLGELMGLVGTISAAVVALYLLDRSKR